MTMTSINTLFNAVNNLYLPLLF